jgi:HPt (histidine-containing phosphotransfer) domain-containing protein
MSDRITVRPDPDLADLIPDFLANRRADVGRIGELLAARDGPALRRIAHDLKGCGSAYGFDPISELGARLERAAMGGDFADAAAAHAQLADYLARVDVRFD